MIRIRSLEEMLVYGANERDLEPEAALKLHAYFKQKNAGKEDSKFPATFDPAYQNHNQASHCWNAYNKFLQCLKDNEGNKGPCEKSEWVANALCPVLWLDKWKEQRADGTFPGVQAPVADDDEDDE